MKNDVKKIYEVFYRALRESQDKFGLVAAIVGALMPLVYIFESDLSSVSAALIVAAAAFGMAMGALSDRSKHMAIYRIIKIKTFLAASSVNKKQNSKNMALSLIYLMHMRRKDSIVKMVLSFFGVLAASFQIKWPEMALLSIAFASTGVLALIVLKEFVVEFRIRKGYFGNNRSEAKAVINFMRENSDDIDFHDDSGNLKKALFSVESEYSASGERALSGGLHS